jgi:hypothetical protein
MTQEQTEKPTPVITVKITAKLKADMKTVDENWSEYIRQCIQKRIDQKKRQDASDKLDEIRKHTKPVSNDELLAWIREGREHQ